MVIAPKIEHGSRALYKCKDGYQLAGGTSNITECYYGNWTGIPPVCQEGQFSPLIEIQSQNSNSNSKQMIFFF